MINNSRILPIYNDISPIKGIQYFVPCILYGEEKFLPWIFSNYIQLEWKEHDCIRFSLFDNNYEGISVLETQVIYRDIIIDNNINIVKMIINNIEKGNYTQICIDEFYIPNKKSYKSFSYIHDNLIYGYNIVEKSFNILGYNSEDRLEKSKITFKQFEQSFYLEPKTETEALGVGSMEYAKKIFILKKRENTLYYIDLKVIIESLEDYLNGTDYFDNYSMIFNKDCDKKSGIMIYDKFINDISNRNQETINDIRISHIIYEHKHLMTLRLKYLNQYIKVNQLEELIKESLRIEELALVIRNLHLKYLLTKNSNIINRLRLLVIDLKKSDKYLIKNILNQLKAEWKI